MKFSKKQSGYSIVEVLIAITILLISIVGPFTIASTGLKNAAFSKQQNIAFFLAQEGLEGVVKHREDNALPRYVNSNPSLDVWDNVEALGDMDCTDEDPCGIDIEDFEVFSCDDRTCDLYYFSENERAHYRHSSSGEVTPYRRELVITTDSISMLVRSMVSWGQAPDERVEISTYVYNIYEN